MNTTRVRLIRLLALGFAFGVSGLRLPAQGTRTQLFTTGSVSNRVNIVLLSEGYTTNQLPQFTNDATAIIANLFAHPPYTEYSNYFNAFAISVASVQSGSDQGGSFRNTYFNSAYSGVGQPDLITIPPNSFDTNYNNGKGKVKTLLTNLMPQYDFVILVVNYNQSGGSGQPPDPNDTLPIAITSVGALASDLIVHESGHTLAGLADEYVGGAPSGLTPVERPNVTMQTNRALIKWYSWISNSVPIPTPDVPGNDSVIGLFLGAQYLTNGWYRPKHDCMMNHVGAPFCEVCAEAIVKAIYQQVRPIDSVSPANPNLTLATPNTFNFSVSNLIPATHTLTVQWFTNNVAAAGATNSTYPLAPGNFPNGNLNLRAVVRDLTPLVRNDPSNLLSNSVSWSVNIAQSSLRLVSPRWLNPNQFAFAVTGTAPLGFTIQASTNLTAWTNLTSASLVGGVFNYTNTGVANFNPRYYRAAVTNTP